MNKQELYERAKGLSKLLKLNHSISALPGVHMEPYLDLQETYIPYNILTEEIIPFIHMHNGYISVNPDRSKHSICLFFKN